MGGPGSGENPGHPFRGNQWSGEQQERVAKHATSLKHSSDPFVKKELGDIDDDKVKQMLKSGASKEEILDELLKNVKDERARGQWRQNLGRQIDQLKNPYSKEDHNRELKEREERMKAYDKKLAEGVTVSKGDWKGGKK
jgi:hypothetical protein